MINKKNILILSTILTALLGLATYWIWIDGNSKCQGKTCNNYDPINLRCNKDAIVIAEDKFGKNTIQLRYSNRCDASWVRADVPANSILYLDDKKGNKIDVWKVPNEKNKIPGFQFGNMGFGRNYKACTQLPTNEIICKQ